MSEKFIDILKDIRDVKYPDIVEKSEQVSLDSATVVEKTQVAVENAQVATDNANLTALDVIEVNNKKDEVVSTSILVSEKAEIVSNAATVVEDRVNSVYIGQSAASIGFATKADLDSNLNYDENTLAIVTNDAIPENNGTYRKIGATGEGSWMQSSFDRVTLLENELFFKADLILGKNLFDKTSALIAYYMTEDGVAHAYDNYDVSDYIKVKPNTEYVSASSMDFQTFFDVNKNVVDGGSSDAVKSITTTAETVYVRVSIKHAILDTFQLEEGSAATEYESFKKIISSEQIPEGLFLTNESLIPIENDIENITNSVTQNTTSLKEKADLILGKNLFDKTSIIPDSYMSTSGYIAAYDGYGISDFIKVQPDTQYISASRMRFTTFFDINKNVIDGGDEDVYTLTTSADTAYVRVTVYNSDLDVFQLEEGSTATEYESYGKFIDESQIKPKIPEEIIVAYPKLYLNGDGQTAKVETQSDGHTIAREFRPFYASSVTTSSEFKIGHDVIDGVDMRGGYDDDAPYRMFSPRRTIGANHGWDMFECSASAHGKTIDDAGAIYSNDDIEYILIGIKDADTLYMAQRNELSYSIPNDTYVYVSNGSNTDDIVVSSNVMKQWYQVFQNHTLDIYIDGVLTTEKTGEFHYDKNIQFVESYEVLDRSELVAWWENNAKSGSVNPQGMSASFRVSITHTYDMDAQYTVYSDFMALKEMTLGDIMFLQAVKFNPADGNVSYYIPNSLPVTHDDVDYNYAMVDDADTSSWSSYYKFTPDVCEPSPAVLLDRVIQLSDNYYYAMGYIPIYSTSLDERRDNATVKALEISTGAKIYLSAIDKGETVLNKGESFGTIGYRNFGVRPANMTSFYKVRTIQGTYLYVDFHNKSEDFILDIEAEDVGKHFEIVTQRNVSNLSKVLNGKFSLTVDATNDYAFLVLKIN